MQQLFPPQVSLGVVFDGIADFWQLRMFAPDIPMCDHLDWNLWYRQIKEQCDMARSSSSKPVDRPRDNMQTTWVNVNLTSEDKEVLKNAETSSDELAAALVALVLEGYEFRLKPSRKEDSYMAFLFPPDNGHAHSGFALSAFAADPRTALTVLLYKHFEVLGTDWTRNVSTSGDNFG